MILRSRIEELERRLLESQARVHAAEAETVEQARLLGMSAERECALRSKLEAAKARILELNRELDAEIAQKTARLIEESNRADAAEAYVQALEEVCDSEQLKCAQSSARQQGGAK